MTHGAGGFVILVLIVLTIAYATGDIALRNSGWQSANPGVHIGAGVPDNGTNPLQ